MSEYHGDLRCDFCGCAAFTVQDWETYRTVICAVCHKKLGELQENL